MDAVFTPWAKALNTFTEPPRPAMAIRIIQPTYRAAPVMPKAKPSLLTFSVSMIYCFFGLLIPVNPL
jgi:hypothetical protein